MMCLQVWSLFNLSSNIWSSPCMDSLLWPRQKRLQCWRPAPWNGPYPQTDWVYHCEGQECCHWVHQEVPPCTSLGSNNCCRCWTQPGVRREWNDLDNPEEVVATRSRPTGFQHVILLFDSLLRSQHLQLRSREARLSCTLRDEIGTGSWFLALPPTWR